MCTYFEVYLPRKDRVTTMSLLSLFNFWMWWQSYWAVGTLRRSSGMVPPPVFGEVFEYRVMQGLCMPVEGTTRL